MFSECIDLIIWPIGQNACSNFMKLKESDVNIPNIYFSTYQLNN